MKWRIGSIAVKEWWFWFMLAVRLDEGTERSRLRAREFRCVGSKRVTKRSATAGRRARNHNEREPAIRSSNLLGIMAENEEPKGLGHVWGAVPLVEEITFEALHEHAKPPLVRGEMQFNGKTYIILAVEEIANLTISIPGVGVMTGPGFRIRARRAGQK